MAQCISSKISTTDCLVLGVVQIMIGIFHVLMWYFVLLLYMGQIQGVFGVYKPLTYKTGSALWGIVFIISGIFIIRTTKQPTYCMVASALTFTILSLITAIAAIVLTVIELSHFQSVSYRNYGQAKLGRVVSRILLISYHLEVSIAFVYSLVTAINLSQTHEESISPADEAETSF